MSDNDKGLDIRSKGYLNEAFRVFHNTDILGTDTPVHFHTFYKATFVKYGRGSYMIDGRVYDIKAGDIILVGINMPHQPVFEAGELYDRYTVYISAGMLEQFDIPECHISGLFSSSSGNVIRPEKEAADRFVRLFEKIDRESSSSSYAAPLFARLLVIRFLIEAARCRQESSLDVPLIDDNGDLMLTILRYINEHLRENISVTDIASHFDMKDDEISASFKEAFGCLIDEYITNRRLTRAREQIMLGVGPAEACYECGYESYPEFTEDYRKKYGTLPRAVTNESYNTEMLSDFFPE